MADASELVQLNLIAPSHVEPVPDKGNFGRFDKVLRSVGSPRTVHVRPRMITVVSETKYVTKSGLPVSLIGLHGKDELLVVGPVWALLKLASGQRPKESNLENSHVEYQRALQTIVEEAFWLLRVRTLLAVSSGMAWHARILSQIVNDFPPEAATYFLKDPLWLQMENDVAAHEESKEFVQFAATDLLQGMFRCSIESVQEYFSEIKVVDFIQEYLKECINKHQEMIAEAEERSDIHSMWWAEWEEKPKRYSFMPNFLVKSGRNITAYPTKSDTLFDAKPRRYSMHEKWKTTVAKYQELISAV
jgi:hypothetical protein